MLGIYCLLLSILCGFIFCRTFFPKLSALTSIRRKNGSVINLPRFYIMFPAWFVSGSLILTWLIYIVSYLAKGTKTPLFTGDAIVLPVVTLLVGLWFIFNLAKGKLKITKEKIEEYLYAGGLSYTVFALLVLVFATLIMYRTLFVRNGEIFIGYSVWADFGAHMGLIRSFSSGRNFPTHYPYFTGEDIKYHFMFQFMVGNFEFLGLRLDHAFNIPSILGLFSAYLLLFTLTVNIFKNKVTAWLGALLFTFRSSFSVFRFLADIRGGRGINVFKALLEKDSYFPYTEHEEWGLWCTRVYCNQRHLAFGISVMLLAVLIFLPYFFEMWEKLKELKKQKREEAEYLNSDIDENDEDKDIVIPGKVTFWEYIKRIFFSKDSFWFKDVKLSVGMGLILGMSAFWHGSALIAACSMLFFMAALSVYRLDYLIAAVIAVILGTLQSKFFVSGSALGLKYFFGFLANNKTVFGVLSYIFLLTGLIIPVALLGASCVKGFKRYLLLVFMIPFVLAFTVQVAPDITINHKWIMMSLMMISGFAAHFITKLFKKKQIFTSVIAVMLLICLTFTGIEELNIQRNEDQKAFTFKLNDPTVKWVSENIAGNKTVLSSSFTLNSIVMGGAMLYYGYPYASWSAGYDTSKRGMDVCNVFEAESPEILDSFAKEYGIDYIVIEPGAREAQEYYLREDVIESTFKEVYSEGEGFWSTRIFDVAQPIY